MHAAFVVVAAKPGRTLGEHHFALARRERPSPPLYFEPRHHEAWCDDAGTLVMGAWQRSITEHDPAQWCRTLDGIAMYTGWPRPQSAASSRTGRAQVLAALDPARLAREAENLQGLFLAVVLGRDGTGSVVADPMGLRFMYVGENDEVFVVSSQASLAATALAPASSRPPKDARGVCRLAHFGHHVGDRSGYQGVTVAPPGAVVRLGPGRVGVLRRARPPWLEIDHLRAVPSAELIDTAREAMAAPVRSLAAADVDSVVDLTGGLDTRLVLALILSEGLRDAFRFETVGPPDLVDVQVAERIARDFGLRHHAGFPSHGEAPPYPEMVKAFVAGTGGICNAFDARPLRPRSPRTRVSGANGECLRAHQAVRRKIRSAGDVVRLVEAGHGRLALLRREAEAELRGTTHAAVLDDAPGDLSPLDLLDSYHFRSRARSRYGPLDELQHERRLLPLYSIDAIRAAFALGGEARQAALLHFEVIRRASDSLAREPFAGPGWPDRLLDALPNGDVYRMQAAGGVPREAPALIARLQQEIADDRMAFLSDVLSEHANPAWELIDRDAVERALARYGELSNAERKELFGSFTAALWLGDHTDE